MIKLCGIISLAVLLHSEIQAATLFCDPAGKDDNPGTIGAPKKTLAGAMSAMSGGDTLFIRGGTYTAGITSGWKSGSAGNPTIVTPYNGESVTIQPVGTGPGFIMSRYSYIRLQGPGTIGGFVVDGINGDANFNCIKIDAGANHIDILGMELKNTPSGHGILMADSSGSKPVLGTANNSLVTNIIHHISFNWDHGSADHGIYLSGNCQSNNVRGNKIYDAVSAMAGNNHQQCGIHQFDGDNSQGNVYAGNEIFQFYHGMGIYHGHDDRIFNNLIYSNRNSAVILRYHIRNTRVDFNTLTKQLVGIETDPDTGTGNSASCNLIVSNSYAGIGISQGITLALTNNMVSRNAPYNLTDPGNGAILSGNNINNSFDPAFVDANHGNYRLSASSAAINSAISLSGISTDFYGTSRLVSGSPDAGYFEYSVAGPATPHPGSN